MTAIGRAGKRYLRRAGHCAYEPAIEPEPAAPQPWGREKSWPIRPWVFKVGGEDFLLLFVRAI